MFSDTLEVAREHLETGSQVVLQCEATFESDQLKLLGRSVSPIDTAVTDAGSSALRVFLDAADAIPSVRSVLENAMRDNVKGGRGPIYFCLMNPDLPGEVELDLGQDFPVNPQIKGALRSLQGVIEVEEA
jgi:DNA polymerase-3 subunit alpha